MGRVTDNLEIGVLVRPAREIAQVAMLHDGRFSVCRFVGDVRTTFEMFEPMHPYVRRF